MSLDCFIFSIVFEGVIPATQCCEENFIRVLDVMIGVATFDLFEFNELFVKAVLDYLLLAMGKAQG